MSTISNLSTLNIAGLARVISEDWKNVNYAALPYLQAMRQLDTVQSSYGLDDGKGIVLYFLCNASSWRGEVAKAVKAELKRRAA